MTFATTSATVGTHVTGFRVLCFPAILALAALTGLPAAEIPPLAPPAGSISVVRDTAANFWALTPTADGRRELMVLPANAPTAWTPARMPNVEPDQWLSVTPQSDRGVFVASARETRRFDPRTPEKAAIVQPAAARSESVVPPWRLVSRMPSSNHDLSAAVENGRLYLAGGMTWDWGLPAKNHFFDELWALDPQTWTWSIAARFSQPRVYCSTVAFAGRIWIVGGDVIESDGTRHTVNRVEAFDPRTGQLARAPDLPFALPAPCTLAAGGRLWVVGSRNRDERGQMASIGPGETAWRVEAEALPHMWALAGTALDDKIYVCVPNTGLAVFDPATRKWSVIPGPSQPRSCQVAAWRGEIWLMGGTDVADWSETWIHNPTARTWRRGPSLPARLAWGAAAVIDDQLVVTGGATPRITPEGRTYDFSDRTFALPASAIPPAGTMTEGGRPLPRWSDAKLRGTGGTGLPFTSERIFPAVKFDRLGSAMLIPTARPDEPRRWLVVEVDHATWTLPDRPDVTHADPFFDLPGHLGNPAYTLAVAFHPRYPAVPQAFVLYNNRGPAAAEDVLARFPVELSDPPRIDLKAETVLLRWPSRGHDGGDLRFGPDGFLYVSVGDRSAPGDPNNLTQRLDLIGGGMLRLDVDHADPGKNYAVPADNPFVGLPDVLPEFWAYGLRNPFRMSFAPTGELWVGDNGDDSWESVHLIRKGHNYGWSTFEGSHPFKRNRPLAGPTPRLTPPVIELPHSESRSVIGGFVYRGKELPELIGQYVFGDYTSGSVWAFKWDGAAPQNFRRVAETRGQILSFAEDRAGEIVMARYDGQIHRLVAAPPPVAATAPFPAKLSGTGLFASTVGHVAAPGVVPYEINAGAWSDGAQARRLLAVPEWQPIAPGEGDAAWNLPEGSVLARTLELPGPRRVETQVMYREHGTWRFYTYAWNEAQTDADLVRAEGETRPVPGLPAQKWRFSGRSECTICHTTQTNFTIGLTTAQLNRDADFTSLGRKVENQIVALADAGLIRPAPAKPPTELPRKVDPADTAFPLEARARAYLDVNCAHCHRPLGVGGRPGIHFTESVPLARAGIVNAKPLVPLLGTESMIVAPGRPEQSELLHRITLEGGGRMPLLGSEQVDKAGVELIRRWIAELKP